MVFCIAASSDRRDAAKVVKEFDRRFRLEPRAYARASRERKRVFDATFVLSAHKLIGARHCAQHVHDRAIAAILANNNVAAHWCRTRLHRDFRLDASILVDDSMRIQADFA
jgi:hypothetical protein